MKTIILFLFAICICTYLNGQTKNFNSKQELLNLLKSKHDYERLLITSRNRENALPFKTKYEEPYAKVLGSKRKIIEYIDNSLKVNEQALSEEFIFYQYHDPFSSKFDKNNRISLATYYKLIKFSLETSKVALPELSASASL